ncbi:MAG: type II secretion system protein [Phycisphaerae bacterium]
MTPSATSFACRAARPGFGQRACGCAGFTILEVLVVLGTMVLLASLLLPGLAQAREQAKAAVCGSNVKQIMLANSLYAEDFSGIYCPGASDFLRNLDRWHGHREHADKPFESSHGPLVDYLGPEGAVRQCPTFASAEIGLEHGGFERGNGGYGYNNAFIGTQTRRGDAGAYSVSNDRAGVPVVRVARPSATIMFTDAAFAADALIEYSFAEPRFHPGFPTARADPSIHFRHRDRATVGWVDGHVDRPRRTFTYHSGFYPTDPQRFHLGWFGQADDNSLFDLR